MNRLNAHETFAGSTDTLQTCWSLVQRIQNLLELGGLLRMRAGVVAHCGLGLIPGLQGGCHHHPLRIGMVGQILLRGRGH